MAKQELPPIKIECRVCLGDGWVYPGYATDQRYKATCHRCQGAGYLMISPFEFDLKKNIKL